MKTVCTYHEQKLCWFKCGKVDRNTWSWDWRLLFCEQCMLVLLTISSGLPVNNGKLAIYIPSWTLCSLFYLKVLKFVQVDMQIKNFQIWCDTSVTNFTACGLVLNYNTLDSWWSIWVLLCKALLIKALNDDKQLH